MKSFIFGLCALFLCFSFGCSKKAELGTEKNPYQIVWYMMGKTPKDLPMVIEKVNGYTKKKIGVTVNIKMFEVGDYTQKMQLVQASGEPYDLCFTCSWANDFRLASSKGYFLELNDLLDKYGQGILKILNPLFLEGTKIDGKNYAVPTNKEIAAEEVYRFNKNLIDKYKFDLSTIHSMADLEPMLKIIHENEPNILPFAYCPMAYGIPNIEIIVYPMPGAVIGSSKNHIVVNQYENKQYLEMMNTYHKFYELGYIDKDVVQKKNGNYGFNKGNVFCEVAGYQPEADRLWTKEAGFPVVSVPSYNPAAIINNMSVSGAMTAISVTSERPDLAMKFLNLLNTDVYLRNLLQYGIEGVHYKKEAENHIEFLPKADDYRMTQWSIELGNLFITYLLPGDPANKWEQFKEMNNNAAKAKILGFSFDATPVKTEIAAMMTAYEQYGKGLHWGAYDPKIFLPKMLKKMKECGMNKVISEMQKQLDAWWVQNKKTETK